MNQPTRPHQCTRPLHVAGVLRCTSTEHYWQPVNGAAATPADAR